MMSDPFPDGMTFTLTPGEETWTVVGPLPDSPVHVVPSPFSDEKLVFRVKELRQNSSMKFSPEQKYDIRLFEDLAHELSEILTPVLLSEASRRAVVKRLRQFRFGRARITLRVRNHGPLGDRILALPWEVLAPTPREFPVRRSLLEIVRESVVENAPELAEPSSPLSVAVVVAAPENLPTLSYEKEEIRIQNALAPLDRAVAFSDLGTLDDLVELVESRRSTAIFFSGHGLPGRLLFENRLGFEDPIDVREVVRRLRDILLDQNRPDSSPGLFFLSSCDGASSEFNSSGESFPSTAAALHRAGFPHVIGYFGPVRDSAAGRAEQKFFEALAGGETALQAAHSARASLVDVFEHEGESFVYPLAWTQLAVYHRGPDRPLATPAPQRGPSLPPRFRRRFDADSGILTQGFVGRRAVRHEFLRKVEEGRRLIVLHGLGGSGKTVLAERLTAHWLARTPNPEKALLFKAVATNEFEDPILALRRSLEEQGRRRNLPDWEQRLAALREEFREPAAGFAATLRALREVHSPTALYVDRLDALRTDPRKGVPGTWRPNASRLWRELISLAADGVLVLVSTRWIGNELPPNSYLGLPPLSTPDALRMMSFFTETAKLTQAERLQLAEWSQGHPRTIELLDQAMTAQRADYGLGYDIDDPWKELVRPVLEKVAEEILGELQLSELWTGLPEDARAHAQRIASKARPLSAEETDRLGDYRDDLIRSGLLVRHLVESGDPKESRWCERWRLPERLLEALKEMQNLR